MKKVKFGLTLELNANLSPNANTRIARHSNKPSSKGASPLKSLVEEEEQNKFTLALANSNVKLMEKKLIQEEVSPFEKPSPKAKGEDKAKGKSSGLKKGLTAEKRINRKVVDPK